MDHSHHTKASIANNPVGSTWLHNTGLSSSDDGKQHSSLYMLSNANNYQEMIRSLKEDSVKYSRERDSAARRNRQPGRYTTSVL